THTSNKKPTTINPYNKTIQSLQTQITSPKHNPNPLIQKPIPTLQHLNNPLQQLNHFNQQLTQPINQLQPLSNNHPLKPPTLNLQNKINQTLQTH
ncbi:hypothetical protein, partial [Staphylococcus epidermidis]|uniref:hypothetical protein n=1 Tax=Staphylococcus epidermidis TaxID=1282 RepID=UPI001C931FF7